MSEIRRILDQMDRAFSGEAWHGPSLMQLLEGVDAESAATRPIGKAHSIWELVNHVTAWNNIVQHRLSGEKVDVTPEMDWPGVWEVNEVGWERSLENLKECRAKLRRAVELLRDDQLDDRVPGDKESFYVLLHGLVQHDLYHAGQIAILKKALEP
ncbi:MAG: DinB family protein [Candidatus Acidiferrales bacterium]